MPGGVGKSCAQRLTASKVFALTNRCTADVTPSISAQRLTASKVFAQIQCLLNAAIVSSCSTPYGIKGFCTFLHRGWLPDRTSAQRLTASKVFAHKIGDHALGADRVLNALRHQRFLHPGTWVGLPLPSNCAQRLTASKVFALNNDFALILHHRVLNALRHQRFLHVWG